MHQIKRVGIFSAAKFFSIFFAIGGIIFGILTALSGNLVIEFITNFFITTKIPINNPLEGLKGIMWISTFTIIPIISAIIGFIIGIFTATIYNTIAKINGLRIDLVLENKI